MNTNLSPKTKCERIKYAAKHAPFLIPVYMKDKSYNTKITTGILSKLIPLRSSIEIECMKSLGRHMMSKDYQYHDLHKYYGIYSYNDDTLCESEYEMRFNEHRISIKNYTQLHGLYKVLEDMKLACELNSDSGIHIHIDMTKYLDTEKIRWQWRNRDYLHNKTENTIVYKIQSLLKSKLDKVYEIFGSCYTGEFNRKDVGIYEKGYWISIRRNTIEFRIGYCTFDYSIIVDWIIQCNQIVQQIYMTIKNSKEYKTLMQNGN